MTERQRHAVLLDLIAQLRANGSGCGEIHVQKAAYFLQELLGVPLDLNVILYQYGPYSFELDDELTALLADGLIQLIPQGPSGPKLVLTDQALAFLSRYPKTVGEHSAAVQFVATRLGPKTGRELEKLATTLYVRKAQPGATPQDQAAEVHRVKPHVTLADARAAVDVVAAMEAEMVAPV